jgi:hypothetical protein
MFLLRRSTEARMTRMILIPYKRQRLNSFGTPSRVALHIQELVMKDRFTGIVSSSGFRLNDRSVWESRPGKWHSWGRWGWDLYAIRILGHIRALEGGAEIDITYTLHPWAIAAIVVLAGLAIQSAWVHGRWTGIWVLSVMHCVLYVLSLAPQRKELEYLFRDLAREASPRSNAAATSLP